MGRTSFKVWINASNCSSRHPHCLVQGCPQPTEINKRPSGEFISLPFLLVGEAHCLEIEAHVSRNAEVKVSQRFRNVAVVMVTKLMQQDKRECIRN